MRFRALFAALGLSLLMCPLFAALPMTDADGKPLPSLAPMLKTVNPAVVNIATFSTSQYATSPLLNDPFFRYFFDVPNNQPKTQRRQNSAGSGVIVDADDGIVLTNFHVINGADEVQVSLVDGRSLNATIVGTDPDLDIAVLKVQADGLSAVKMIDSNRLQVGDFVVAIGNPFALGQTVTTGIVSALGRSGLGIEGYENFIQTDASINPGNSGGALVNLQGELVGINTAIIAPAGGNVGIGFAIPINMAKAAMQQILNYGEVKRGSIGVTTQDLTPMLREAFELKPGQLGVLIADVLHESSAEAAGLQAGDIILSINGQTVSTQHQLQSLLAVEEIGRSVTLAYVRQGKVTTVDVTIEDPSTLVALNNELHPLLKGVSFQMDNSAQLVQIADMDPKSRAAYAGLRPGDYILSFNNQRIESLAQMSKVLDKVGSELLVKIVRSNRIFYVVLR